MFLPKAAAVASRALALQVNRQASTKAGNSRRMVYPYTLAAQLAQFPYKFHFDNVWFVKYSVPAFIITTYVFYKIQRLACSPENYKIYREKLAKEAAEHAEHH